MRANNCITNTNESVMSPPQLINTLSDFPGVSVFINGGHRELSFANDWRPYLGVPLSFFTFEKTRQPTNHLLSSVIDLLLHHEDYHRGESQYVVGFYLLSILLTRKERLFDMVTGLNNLIQLTERILYIIVCEKRVK